MSEPCKTCHKKFDSGIWMSPQFKDEKVLLFCSNKCKKRCIKMKLKRIKTEYPGYYKKLVKLAKKEGVTVQDKLIRGSGKRLEK